MKSRTKIGGTIVFIVSAIILILFLTRPDNINARKQISTSNSKSLPEKSEANPSVEPSKDSRAATETSGRRGMTNSGLNLTDVEPISNDRAKVLVYNARGSLYGLRKKEGFHIVLEVTDYARDVRSTVEMLTYMDEDGFSYRRQVGKIYRAQGGVSESLFIVNKEGWWQVNNGTALWSDPSLAGTSQTQAVANTIQSAPQISRADEKLYEGDSATFDGRKIYVVRQTTPDSTLATRTEAFQKTFAAISGMTADVKDKSPSQFPINAKDLFPKTVEYIVSSETQLVLMENKYAADGRLLVSSHVTTYERKTALSAKDFELPIGVHVEVPLSRKL